MDKQTHGIVLAQNRTVGSVEICGCGTIHVSIGAVSMRLSPEVFGETAAMLSAALQNLLRQGSAMETANRLIH